MAHSDHSAHSDHQIIKDTKLSNSAADKVPTWLIQIVEDTKLFDSAVDKVSTWLIQIIKAADMLTQTVLTAAFTEIPSNFV